LLKTPIEQTRLPLPKKPYGQNNPAWAIVEGMEQQ
jgi:hypothetical protein